jgi:DNA-binding CsgD family transcriptional regulator
MSYNSLSKREKEVIFLSIRGKTAKSIGETLHISKRTVEKHLLNIKVKMNVSTKAELIEKVIDKYIIEGIINGLHNRE